MHIALVQDQIGGKAGGGGGVRLTLELGAGLVRRGHRVTVVCHGQQASGSFSGAFGDLDVRSVHQRVRETSGGGRALARHYWRDLPKVARLVPSDADVVNAHDWPALRAGRIAAGRLKVPLVWTRNNEVTWERAIDPRLTIVGDARWSRRLVRAAVGWPDLVDARRADAIVVLSGNQVELVRRSYRKDATIVPIGSAEQFFEASDGGAVRADLGIDERKVLVLGAGTLVPHRRFEILIEAMEMLGDEPSIQALIVGSDHVDPAYADRLAELIEGKRLGDRVLFPRRSISDAQMRDSYAAADVFVLLSQRFAWGLSPLEAIAAGTPVIITPGAGVHEILGGRGGVQVIPGEDPAALAAAIRGFSRGSGRDGIESTREWLRSEHSIDRYAERMEAIYRSVVGSDSSANGD